MILSARQFQLLVNSLVYAGGVAGFSLLLGLSTGFILAKFDLPKRNLWLGLLLAPLLIPPYLHAIAWRFLFVSLGISTANFLYHLPAAVLITSLAYFPLVTIASYFALRNLNPHLEEMAQLIGTPQRIWRKITLPLVLPSSIVATVVVFLLTLSNFGVTSFLHINVFVYEIFTQFSAFFDFNQANLLTFPLVLVALVALVLTMFGMRRPYRITPQAHAQNIIYHLSRPQQFGVVLFLFVLVALATLLPIGVLVKQTSRLANFWFAIRFSWPVILKSLWLAALGTLIALAVATGLTYFKPRRLNVAYLALATMAIPSVSIGVWLIKIFNRPHLEMLYATFAIIIVGYLARFLPFTWAILAYFQRRLNPYLLEAAYLSGAKPSRVLRFILLPLWLPGIIASGTFFFLLALSELGTTMLVHPSGYQTLPIRIFILMHYGAPELVAALSLSLLLLTLLIIGLAYAGYQRTKLKQIV